MPTAEYWRDQLSAWIEQSAPIPRDDVVITDAGPHHRPDVLLIVRIVPDKAARQKTVEFLAGRARACGFVTVPAKTPGMILICDRDPLPYSYHPDHEGIIGEAEP